MANSTSGGRGNGVQPWGRWTAGCSGSTPTAPPLLEFLVYGVWMLWVTAPEATREIRSARVQQERHRATAPQSPTSGDPAHRGATT